MKRSKQVESKGAEEARQQLPAILDAAAAGKTTIITPHGKEIAAVVPAAAVNSNKPVSILKLAASGRGLGGKSSGRTIDDLRAKWTR